MKLKHEADKNKSTEPPETKPSSAMQCTDDQLVHLETSPIQWPWYGLQKMNCSNFRKEMFMKDFVQNRYRKCLLKRALY